MKFQFRRPAALSSDVRPIATDAVRDALSHVFYVTSWGYGADHWFAWFVKALNANPEILAYLANEGSRPKYFPEERSRAQRPDLIKFTRFLADVGMTYTAIGDCYSYRPTMMHALLAEWPDLVRIVQLTRHPYAWLFFHVRWRTTNMRMLGGEGGPLEHEWQFGCDHKLFKRLGLRRYDKEDIEIWTSYQGMWKMNDVAADAKMPIRQIPIEQVVGNRDLFCEIVDYLTHGRISYDKNLLDLIYLGAWTPFRGEQPVQARPEALRAEWPDWKIEAFDKLVADEAKDCFRNLGYTL
ncbi:MAG: hypothetical protein U1A72_15980 [Sulfuritalea sp.]|nr:hypothetical protein [Sulfuritalea sp.]